MRGRKPSSREEKLAKGEKRPCRVNYEEPEIPLPPDSALEPPKDLRGAGFREWRDYVKILRDSGQLRATHMTTYLAYCRNLTDIENWRKEITLRGLDRAERLKLARLISVLEARSKSFAETLCITPATQSRAKTVTKPPVEKPKHERFFGAGLNVIRGGRS
jgi:hypothetical protein